MSTWHLIASCLLLAVVAVHGRTTIPPLGCTDSVWNVSDNTNVLNGVGNAASTLDACKAACTADTTCLGFDWDPATTPMCWWTGSWSGSWRIGTATGVTHYQIVQRGSCTASPVCATTWNANPDKNVRGGTYQPGVTTLVACQQACLNSASCVGIDWDPNNPSQQLCWLSPSTTLSDAPGVTHYTPVKSTGDQCPTEACVLMQEGGGVLAKNSTTDALYVSDDMFRAVVFSKVPCLDKANLPSFNNCVSYLASDGISYLRGAVDCQLHLSQPNKTIIDRYGTRFAQDTSFLRADDPSGNGYFSLETAAAVGFYVKDGAVSNVTLNWPAITNSSLYCMPPSFLPNQVIKDSCPLVWSKFDSSDVAVENDHNEMNLLDCARVCITRPQCAGISFTAIPDKCDNKLTTQCVLPGRTICRLIYENQPPAQPYTTYNPDFVYYEVQRRMTGTCDRGCLNTWKYTSTLAGEANNPPDPMPDSNVDTEDECRAWCTKERQCVGISFSATTSPPTCKWYKSLTGASNPGYALTRVYDRCGVCINNFSTVLNATDLNAKSVGAATNPQCRTACINNPKCLGYEVHFDDGNCYLSLAPSVLTYPSPYLHTDIIRALPLCGNGCLFKWRRYQDTSMVNGTDVSVVPASNEKACREACQNRPACTSVDWTPPSTCWLALSENVQKNYGTTPGTTQFQLSREQCA